MSVKGEEKGEYWRGGCWQTVRQQAGIHSTTLPAACPAADAASHSGLARRECYESTEKGCTRPLPRPLWLWQGQYRGAPPRLCHTQGLENWWLWPWLPQACRGGAVMPCVLALAYPWAGCQGQAGPGPGSSIPEVPPGHPCCPATHCSVVST